MSVAAEARVVTLTINGRDVTVPAGTTVFDAARMNGIVIPTLCHQQNENPIGVCRLCVVDVGARVYTASCIRQVEPGMKVTTDSADVHGARRTLLELLLSDHPTPCARQQHSGDCELEHWGSTYQVGQPRFAKRTTQRGHDDSSPAIAVDHEACILCERCIRGCGDTRHNFVLARTGKGFNAGIAFDLNDPMGASSCVSCGECMISCPTGALTNKRVIGTELGGARAAQTSVDDLLRLPIFSGVSGTFLRLNQNAVVRRQYKAGEIICREGEFGSTAFYILEGKAKVYLASPMAHVATKDNSTGLLTKLKSMLRTRNEQPREEEVGRRWISIDAAVDLPYDNPIAELGPGDLFGEMTCMNYYPRSATVRAETDCVMLEMLRNVLDILQRNKTFKAHLDQSYKARALETHLRSVPAFASVSPEFIAQLRDRVELLRFAPGQVIVRQGDPADSFYLIRIGFVKVSETRAGGEFVHAYLSRGGFFGEIGLLGGGIRTSTCTALDHVEVVRITGDDFNLIMESFPEVRANLEAVARQRQMENRLHAESISTVPLDQFLSQGLMEAQSLLVLDLERCTRCDQCVRACADAHDGITRLVREGVRFDKYLVATSCRQCRDPLCLVGCPVGSIRRRNSLEVIIEDWCIGCGLCASNCPYGNINLHPFNLEISDPAQPGRKIAAVRQKATSCDLCHDHAEPSCVYACPHDAAHRVEPREFFVQLSGHNNSARPVS